MQVHDRYDYGRVDVHKEEDAKGKTAKDGAPDVSGDERELERAALDTSEDSSQRLQEGGAKAFPFTVVPKGGLESVQFRFGTDAQLGHRALSRRSSPSRTSFQGRASWGAAR